MWRGVFSSKRVSRFWRREDGNSTIEFVFLVPIFISMLASGSELGILMTREIMLNRGVDLAVREIRLGRDTIADADDLKQVVCQASRVLPDCTDNIRVELTTVSMDTWVPTALNGDCIDRDAEIEPASNFSLGGENELMLVVVCVLFDPIFPNLGIGKRVSTESGNAYALVARSAFVNEPN